MIEGVVDASGLPTIEVDIGGWRWRAVIDSGFNGDLELPPQVAPAVQAQFEGYGWSLLAGGQTIREEQYRVMFPFDGTVIEAVATFVDGNEILIGTRLLRDHRLEINFVTRDVVLERVA